MSEFFETICIDEGKAKHLAYHQKRYEATLKAYNDASIISLADVISPPLKEGLQRCRVVYDKEGVLHVTFSPYQPRKITSLKILSSDIEYPKKSTDRSALEELFKQRAECDEILIVKDGYIRDTSIANVAFFDGTRWLTPKNPLLAGTTRARLLDEGRLFEAEIKVEDIASFEKMALLNAMIDFAIISITDHTKDKIVVKQYNQRA